MRYIIVAAAMFGIYCAIARFAPGLLMGMSVFVLLGIGGVATLFIANRVK